MSPAARLLALIVPLALLAAPARAQGPPRGPAAPSAQIFEGVRPRAVWDVDPSLRSAAMGGAGNALFWGGDPDGWANPALLGYQQGLRFESASIDLLGLDASARSTTLAGGGLGLQLVGRPFDPDGGQRVDLLFFGKYQMLESWGVGLSLGSAIASVARLRGGEPPAFTRWADLAVGFRRKEETFDIGLVGTPDPAGGTVEGIYRSMSNDVGALARVTPLDNTRGSDAPTLPLRVDLAYGWSVLNANDADTPDPFQPSVPLTRYSRNGVAVRGTMGVPAGARPRLGPAWLADSFEPLVSLGLAVDWEHSQLGSIGLQLGREATRSGGELALANVFFLRAGHASDGSGTRYGIGVGFRAGAFGGFRYDWATVPLGDGIPDEHHTGWTAYFDPFAIYRSTR